MVNSAGLRLLLLANYIDPSPLSPTENGIMLTRLHYDTIAEAIATTIKPDDFAEFHSLPPEQKLGVVMEIVEEAFFGFPKEEVAEFIVAMALEANAGVEAPLHDIDAVAAAVGYKLDRTQIAWHKPKPPTLYPQLTIKWPEEYAHLGGMAAKVPFASVGNKVWYRNAVHESLGLGGYVDFLLGRQIPETDPTMELFLQGMHIALSGARGEWFDEDGSPFVRLPTGVDGKSAEAIDFAADHENRVRRRDVARKSAAARREKEIAEKKLRRDAAFGMLEAATGWKSTVDALSLTPFDKVHEILTAQPIGFETAGGKTWLPTADIKAFDKVYAIANEEMLEFTEQFVITQVAKRMPSWFKEIQDGTLKIRKAPKIERPKGLDRPTRSLHTNLNRLIERYKIDKVGDALLTLCGFQADWKTVTANVEQQTKTAKA